MHSSVSLFFLLALGLLQSPCWFSSPLMRGFQGQKFSWAAYTACVDTLPNSGAYTHTYKPLTSIENLGE